MLRIASQRLLTGSSRSTAIRNISNSPVRFIKIKHQDGSTNRPSNPSDSTSKTSPSISATTQRPASPSASSPAEKPSSPPVDSPKKAAASSEPFEPIINKATEPAPRTVASSGAVDEPVSPATETPAEEIDYSKLPSLNVDSELAQLAEPAKEKVEDEAGAGSSAGAGAGSTSGKTGARRRGAGRKEYVSSIERQRRAMLRYGIGALVIGGLGAAYFGGAETEKAGAPSVGGWERLKNNANEFLDYFNKPAFKTLLPDPLPPPHQRPYTLLIDLEGMLVTSTWDRTNGWRTAKRPGVDYFLAYLSLFYEIVLFTHQPLYTAAPVAEKLDPFQAYLPYKLFRDSTRTVKGKIVKDLTYLNRDLSKVIMLDTNPEHAALQPENAIIIPPWEGKGGEQGLVELIPFLESIAYYNVKDVRPALQFYQGKDIAQTYAKIEAEQKAQAKLDWERTHPSSVHGAGSSFVSSMFGGLSQQTGKPQRPNQPMTFIEQKRAESQRMYQEEQKYWRDHADEFKKLIEEDKQRQLAEMKGSLWSWMGGAPPAKDAGAQPAPAK